MESAPHGDNSRIHCGGIVHKAPQSFLFENCPHSCAPPYPIYPATYVFPKPLIQNRQQGLSTEISALY